MEIRSLGYDPEADELDLLIDTEEPVPAEAVPVGNGMYIRCEPSSGHVVGAFIRGYSHLIERIRSGEEISVEEDMKAEFSQVFRSILEWAEHAVAAGRPFQQISAGVLR